MKLKNEYLYCVIQKSGHLCLWSMATSRADSWREFKRGLASISRLQSNSVQMTRRLAQAEGLRCVSVQVTLTEERKGK